MAQKAVPTKHQRRGLKKNQRRRSWNAADASRRITNLRGLKKAAMTKQECRGLRKGSRPTLSSTWVGPLTCTRVDCYFFTSGKFQNTYVVIASERKKISYSFSLHYVYTGGIIQIFLDSVDPKPPSPFYRLGSTDFSGIQKKKYSRHLTG